MPPLRGSILLARVTTLAFPDFRFHPCGAQSCFACVRLQRFRAFRFRPCGSIPFACIPALLHRASLFRPFGARVTQLCYPRLTPWASFWRRFAAEFWSRFVARVEQAFRPANLSTIIFMGLQPRTSAAKAANMPISKCSAEALLHPKNITRPKPLRT